MTSGGRSAGASSMSQMAASTRPAWKRSPNCMYVPGDVLDGLAGELEFRHPLEVHRVPVQRDAQAIGRAVHASRTLEHHVAARMGAGGELEDDGVPGPAGLGRAKRRHDDGVAAPVLEGLQASPRAARERQVRLDLGGRQGRLDAGGQALDLAADGERQGDDERLVARGRPETAQRPGRQHRALPAPAVDRHGPRGLEPGEGLLDRADARPEAGAEIADGRDAAGQRRLHEVGRDERAQLLVPESFPPESERGHRAALAPSLTLVRRCYTLRMFIVREQ